jgi:multimeric flavodoxin WrbA
MKVIGISGSPRKGNTEFMVQTLLEKVTAMDIQTELILLRKMNIKGCTGCLTCEAGGNERKGICRIKDDMEEIYPKLLKVDGLVMGTPVYFEMVSGLLKNFMDRTCPIWTKLSGKPVIGVAVAEEGIGKAIDNLKTYVNLCDMVWIGSVTALAKTSGQVAGDKAVKTRLNNLSLKFVNAVKVKNRSIH